MARNRVEQSLSKQHVMAKKLRMKFGSPSPADVLPGGTGAQPAAHGTTQFVDPQVQGVLQYKTQRPPTVVD